MSNKLSLRVIKYLNMLNIIAKSFIPNREKKTQRVDQTRLYFFYIQNKRTYLAASRPSARSVVSSWGLLTDMSVRSIYQAI